MSDFPTLLYRTPGHHGAPGGASFDYIGASDQDAFDRLVSEGWAPSLADALGKEPAKEVIKAADALENALEHVDEPTRDSLEAQAKALHIGFNWKTSNKALAEKIAARNDQ